MRIIGNDWDEVIGEEFEKPYYKQLRAFLDEEYKNKTIYPIPKYIYTALRLTPYKDTRVVILGQAGSLPRTGPGPWLGFLRLQRRPGPAFLTEYL